MIDLLLAHEYLTIIKDVVSKLSTTVLVTVAILGLQTWKRQLKGKTEYELARRLLRSVYKTRDAIRAVRSPFAGASEISASLEEAEIEIDQFDPEFYSKSQAALYQRRWRTVQEALAELDLETFEAEVVWGKEIRDLLIPFRQQIGKLHAHIELYLRNLRDPSRQEHALKMAEKIDEVIYDFHDLTNAESENPYTKKQLKL